MPVDPRLTEYGWETADSKPDHVYTFPVIESLFPINKGQRLNVFDAGCGNSTIAMKISALGHQVTGIDISEDRIVIATKVHPKVHFEVASVYDDLPSIIDDVDVVVSSEVIEHLYDPQRYLDNMMSIIRTGGYVILTAPYHGYLKNLALSLFNYWDKHNTVDWVGGHIKFFSENTLSKMLIEAGFSNVTYNNVGRLTWLWKSMVFRAQKQ